MRLLLIRHAESQGNHEGRFQGQLDFPLSPRGVEQAVRLAARLGDRHLDHIYASPLTRASHTARLVAEAKGMAVTPLPHVQEYDFGELSGLTRTEIEARHPEFAAVLFTATPGYVPWPGEEGRDIFRERVCTALWGLEREHAGETVAVFTHGGVIAVFCRTVLGLPEDRRPPFVVDNAGIFEVEVRDGKGTLHSANDVCHLREA